MLQLSKRLIVFLFILFLIAPAAVHADSGTPENGVLACTYQAPQEAQTYTEHLCDGDPFTTVTLFRGESLTMVFPKNGTVKQLCFEFFELPEAYELLFFDANGVQVKHLWISEITGIHQILPMEYPDAASVTLKATTGNSLILSEWLACTDAFVPPFPDTDAHADVLVVLNRPGDELELLGGLLAQLAGEHGLSVQVVYLTKADGYHTQQCIEVLRRMGVTRMPVFGRGRDNTAPSENAVYAALGTRVELVRRFTKQIRALQPKLILTLDRDLSQPRYTDSVIADIVCTAAGYASDASRYPETEAFAPDKVYTLCAQGTTVLDLNTPLYAFDGTTADALADALYPLYREGRGFRRHMRGTVRFSLAISKVGRDEAGNDLLEHLPTDRFAGYRAPTPPPTPEPSATPAPAETPAPTAAPTEAPSPVPTETPAPRKGLFSCGGKEETPAPVETPSPAPTEAPTEAPTPEPSAEPTPEPTPDPEAAYFLDGDGEEYNLDFDAGHWWYKNRVLSVDIVRIQSEYPGYGPLVYYVADIRMREYSSYRSGIRHDYLQPHVYVRKEKAVFAITGDNLDKADKHLKGCVIRKGVYYYNAGYSDTMLIGDDMTIRVLPRKEASTRYLLDHGVRDTYSFGPTLVENGVVNPDIHKHRVSKPNPRCGIGMVEPGHWIAIVTDGRQYDYSYSITLEYFAEMFRVLGCTVAYNLDGGASAAMCIMGETLNKHIAPNTIDSQRPWIDAIMFGYSEQLPSPDEPTEHDGYHHPPR